MRQKPAIKRRDHSFSGVPISQTRKASFPQCATNLLLDHRTRFNRSNAKNLFPAIKHPKVKAKNKEEFQSLKREKPLSRALAMGDTDLIAAGFNRSNAKNLFPAVIPLEEGIKILVFQSLKREKPLSHASVSSGLSTDSQ